MDKALLARVEKQAWFHRYPRGWPLLLFVLVAAGTLLSVMAIERAEADRRQIELDRNVTELASGLQRRASENIAILRAGAALFTANERVSPEAFADIAKGLYGDNDYHGSRGIAWARWTPADDFARFEKAVQDVVDPAYRIKPGIEPGRKVYVPIVYIEPRSASNRTAIGFDMYSEPVRREAMDLAAALGQPVASGLVHLVQDRDTTDAKGFLIYMPVFAGQGSERHVRGFVYSPFRASEFLGSAVELVRDRGVEIAIYDGQRQPDRLLAARMIEGDNDVSLDRRIVIANRPWIVSVSFKRARTLSALSRATLVFGAVLGVLVMFIARLITKRSAEDRIVLEWFSDQSAIRNSLTRELNHRVKNTLANVLSIVALTRRRSVDLDDFAESLTGRIRALSATHDLLSQSDWTDAPVAEIVRSELAPYMGEKDGHIDMAGPAINLAPNDAMSLGLAIHELATNAAKYGALSTTQGRVYIEWRLIAPDVAELHWREAGGPPVVAPRKRGFGRDLLEKIVAHELGSKVDLRFDPEGVECTLQVPVRKLTSFALRSTR
ncbi:CHASE domain-containing protein [Novosphingobium sp. JCM 18896]|uniref:CHASE domain-containing protein n=1 Tax=Novosphingobium sp. JCM 18896 TaxID=2989731 RepID=UPI002222006A|nr:CHASE domain-containing protein [Novosphingobium sp. JCM 18896]MCW1429753.1 CHASE domain-containing protein [Novosphingobium sp. JCM 18896]